MEQFVTMKHVVGSVVYTFLGLAVFVFGFVVLDKVTPGDMWKQIIDEKNVAVAVLAGSVAIGISLIIAAAIGG